MTLFMLITKYEHVCKSFQNIKQKGKQCCTIAHIARNEHRVNTNNVIANDDIIYTNTKLQTSFAIRCKVKQKTTVNNVATIFCKHWL
jgi:hypothetical protein